MPSKIPRDRFGEEDRSDGWLNIRQPSLSCLYFQLKMRQKCGVISSIRGCVCVCWCTWGQSLDMNGVQVDIQRSSDLRKCHWACDVLHWFCWIPWQLTAGWTGKSWVSFCTFVFVHRRKTLYAILKCTPIAHMWQWHLHLPITIDSSPL